MQISENAVVIVKDRAGFEPVCNVFGFVSIRGPDRSSESELTLIRAHNGVVVVIKLENRHDGSELFAADDLILLPCAQHQGRQQELSIRPFIRIEWSAFRQHLQIRRAAAAKQATDNVELSFVIERPIVVSGLRPSPTTVESKE